GARLSTMSGARLLTSFSQQGSYWVAVGQTQEGQISGVCLPNYPRCNRPEDFFFDDVAFVHVDSLSNLGPGKYYFDYGADTIYFYDDPTGHKVETSVTRAALVGNANNVTVQDLIMEKYASPDQMGAIGDQYGPGQSWTVQNIEARWNHGTAI